jgi:uncharacterized protein (DUF488 family)
VIEIYASAANENKLSNRRFEEKELILKTKCETAEKMIKDYELKYLSSEKEKNKYKKMIDELNDRLEHIKEKNDNLLSGRDTISLLENNNKVLLKTNESLLNQISELKDDHDAMNKRFEEEVNIILERLEKYKSLLNKLQNRSLDIF